MLSVKPKPGSKIYGIVPARMAASRFPGKPLAKICGLSMVEHVFYRASFYDEWDGLCVATCDAEIIAHCEANGIDVVMTSATHDRALDRVAEAAKSKFDANDDDIIVCLQGDEPMMRPDMVNAVVAPIQTGDTVATVLGMEIKSEEIWLNPDTVKIVANERNEVMYTSRAPIPYSKTGFNNKLGCIRIYGIFAFRSSTLKLFTKAKQTRLEKLEACDSNRIFDLEFIQTVAKYPYCESYSVDSPEDLEKVKIAIESDDLTSRYIK